MRKINRNINDVSEIGLFFFDTKTGFKYLDIN